MSLNNACRPDLCSHLTKDKLDLHRMCKSALIPDYIIPLDVDEIWDDSLLFYCGLLLCLEMWRKSAKHNGLCG